MSGRFPTAGQILESRKVPCDVVREADVAMTLRDGAVIRADKYWPQVTTSYICGVIELGWRLRYFTNMSEAVLTADDEHRGYCVVLPIIPGRTEGAR